MTIPPSYVYVSAYSQSQSGTADIYVNCLDGYSDLSEHPNLKPIDSIQAAGYSTDYNCFAWAGGIMDGWFYPAQSILTPWYNSDRLVALENFLGNNPPRYAGAITYVYTTNANESIVDVYEKNNNWVHASVRKPGNDMPHGYDWESKMGSDQRIFHTRNSLEDSNYGTISRYYKYASYAMSSSPMTFEQSVSDNKTKMSIPSFSNSEKMILHEYRTKLNNSILNEFDEAYCSWINSIKNNKELNNTSNAFEFIQVPEFNCLKEIIKRNPDLYLKVMDLYIQNQDIYSRVLFETTVVLKNERTIELANQIREEKNNISRESINSNIYIAPSFKTNAIAFIKEVISNSSYYLEENN